MKLKYSLVYVPVNKRPWHRYIQVYQNKFVIDRNTNCWNWIGYVNEKGYPKICVRDSDGKKRSRQAHRVFYEKKNNVILDRGVDAHHTCRNRRCVNPEHVEPLTHSENCSRDFCRLTYREVLLVIKMKDDGVSYTKIAKSLGVNRHVLSRYCQRVKSLEDTNA